MNTLSIRRLYPWSAMLLGIALVYVIVTAALAHAGVDPALREIPVPGGWSLAEVLSLVALIVASLGLILGAIGAVLHFVAPRTKTTLDDRAAEAVDSVHAKLDQVLGMLAAIGATPPAAPAARPAVTVVNVAPSSPPGTGTAAMLVLLLLGGLMVSQISCATLRPAAGTGVVAGLDCEAAHLDAQTLADAKAFAEAKVQRWISGTGAQPDATAIKADLAPIKSDLGRCALAAALAAATAVVARPASESVTFAARSSGDLRATFSAAAREAGWAPVKLADGTVL